MPNLQSTNLLITCDLVSHRPDLPIWDLAGQPILSTNQSRPLIYIHADMALKEQALARTTPPDTAPGRYTAPDTLLAFLRLHNL